MEEETPNGFNDWEHLLASSAPPPPAATTTTTYTSDDPFLSVFPPINHEGLPVSSSLHDSHHYNPSTTTTTTTSVRATTSSPSTPPRPLPTNSRTGDPTRHQHSHSQSSISPVHKWVGVALQMLNSRLLSVISNVRSRGLLLLFPSQSSVSVGGVMAAASLMVFGAWMWWRRRIRRRLPRRSTDDTIERLNLLIREKDEKIIELLNQVADLNKLMLARYRVPVVREC